MPILSHTVLPVASDDDAEETCAALRPYLDSVDHVTAVHVIEKGGGAVDKAPLAKRRSDAEEFLGIVESSLCDDVAVDTRIAFGTDVVETIFEEVRAVDATAVAFRPRGGSRIVQFLAGDTANKLVTDPALPVISLPEPAEMSE